MQVRIAVVGLGYVGLPVAVAFAEKYAGTIGFDIDTRRVAALAGGEDWTGEVGGPRLKASGLTVTSELGKLKGCDIFIVCVPTPIHRDRRPNLDPLRAASESVGQVMKKGALVIYESTVYPGVTEDYCGAILAKVSGLKQGRDFKLGYSPERINPGDREHTFETILKVTAGEDEATADRVAALYDSVVKAGIFRARSIKVAEAAKALENTQRDLNIALMNEMAIICDAMKIRTRDVLDAAATKWNFLPFAPGLVGGHCIGVDPYYLTSKAQELGYNPQVILAGRRINDSMGNIIARRVVRFLAQGARPVHQARVGILGLTFKENVPDIRNSRVPDILAELKTFGIKPLAHDPRADAEEIAHEYGLSINKLAQFRDLDALILAVPHRDYLDKPDRIAAMLADGGILADIKSVIDPAALPGNVRYWSL
ncbi:MAG TPA: nucleotide sugar dehydrogenase [Rhizomicrobium sp.]|jgi:UDP-N-acetyl-D-galactosamine dehydrogenase|nr:nucleotide sugar dehydrogenase [Rhizomicrobium sp.]